MPTEKQEPTQGNPQVGELRFTEDMPIQAYTQLLDKMVGSATVAEDFYKVGMYDNTFIELHVNNPEEAFKKVAADLQNPELFANYEPVPARSFEREDESRQVFNWNSQYIQLQLLRNVQEDKDNPDALVFISSHHGLPAGFTKDNLRGDNEAEEEQKNRARQLARQKEHATVVTNFLHYCENKNLRGALQLRIHGDRSERLRKLPF